jgi:hypothetical protein
VTKVLLVIPAILLACLCVVACGGTGSAERSSTGVARHDGRPATSTSSLSNRGYMTGDEDIPTDDEGNSDDDVGTLHYGRAATAAERQAIAAVAMRYYAAVAAGDGAAACALMSSRLAASTDLEGELPEAYRPAPGLTLFRGKSCADVESLLFEVDRRALAEQAASVRVIGARVKGAASLALLGFRSSGEQELWLVLEHGAWKVDALLGRRLV